MNIYSLEPEAPACARTADIQSAAACARSTIDWYNAWPRTALHSVAHRILAKLAVVPSGPQECGVGPKMAASLMRISVDVHDGVSTSDESEIRTCGSNVRGAVQDDCQSVIRKKTYTLH